MFTIEKITVSYDAEEDRLHLAVINEQEQTLGLWLIRPLANLLVGVLLGELAESEAGRTDAHVRSASKKGDRSISARKGTDLFQDQDQK